jgi:hypothetical protein
LSKFSILYHTEEAQLPIATYSSKSAATDNMMEGEKQTQDTELNTGYFAAGDNQNYQLFTVYDPFDLREELMRYTNPLRTKILLFYTIYRMEVNEQHWSIVRNCTLDELMFRLIRSYGNTRDLELELYYKARALPDPDENLKTAKAILKILDNFYSKQ